MTAAHDIPPERIAQLHAIRDLHLGQSGATQRKRMREALETLGSVTTFEAMRHLDIFDPRPRKLELVRMGRHPTRARRTGQDRAISN